MSELQVCIGQFKKKKSELQIIFLYSVAKHAFITSNMNAPELNFNCPR